jgi:hypothetical protein
MPVNVPINKGMDIEEGTYEVLCLKVWADKLKDPQFGTGDVLKIKLQFPDLVNEDTNEFFEMDAMANFTLSPRSKLYGWAMAFGCKVDLEANEFDAEQMVGKVAQAVIIKDTKKDGSIWPAVDSIVPAPKKRSAGSTGPTAASSVRSVIMPDGKVNFAIFWQELARLGGTREGLMLRFNVDVEGLSKQLAGMDAADVAMLLEELV